MRLEDLIVRLRIEEDNCASEKKVGKGFMESKANVKEHGQTSHNHKKRRQQSQARSYEEVPRQVLCVQQARALC